MKSHKNVKFQTMKTVSLIQKYNVPGPRYTSYPTVPFWENNELSTLKWMQTIHRNFGENKTVEISVYIHLPFCESLCTFCGCHKRITKNHTLETPYLTSVEKEWKLYLKRLPFNPIIKELHLGGGTPTFFSAKNLDQFLTKFLKDQPKEINELEYSFEAHPTNTTEEHLTILHKHGFRRLSLGIQDYNAEVQIAIHRIQSIEQVTFVHELAKKIGYTSISHDLVYGLPKQTLKHIEYTVNETLKLRPERISLYSYAHVPWIKGNGQRGYDEKDLPKNEEKRALYERAKALFLANGYFEIGMDHFALETDSLYIAFKNKKLHRNFMGYTTQFTPLLIGLGMSSISDSWFGFSQNHKDLSLYIQQLEKDKIPIERGHILSEDDLLIRKHILDLMCHFETKMNGKRYSEKFYDATISRLKPLIEDGLVTISGLEISVTETGIPFVRNCCMAFDQKLHQTEIQSNLFSQTI